MSRLTGEGLLAQPISAFDAFLFNYVKNVNTIAKMLLNHLAPWIRSTWHILAVGAILWLGFIRYFGTPDTSELKTYPRRPIKVVVPFGAGGSSDTFVRMIQKTIADEKLLNQPLVVINRGGGSATIGSRSVKTAKADGYTLLNLHDAIFTAKRSGKVPYGPEAFEPIAATSRVSMVVIVADDSPYQTLGDLLRAARDRPETVGFGANVGAPSHFAGLLLEQALPGARFRYIQSGGGQQRYTKLLGGHLDVGAFSIDEFVNFGTDGRIRALAVLSDERQPALERVPTAREQGFEVIHYNTQYWWAPKGTPPARVEAFAKILQQAMQSETTLAWLKQRHTEPLFARGNALTAMLQARDETLNRVDLRKPIDLPNFAAIIGMIVGVLLLWVIVGVVYQRRYAPPVDPTSGPTRPGLALGFTGLALLYTGSMQSHLAGFAWATTAFVFASGVLLGQRRPIELLILAQLALIVGLGTELLFTEIFVIDLPGGLTSWMD